MAKIKKKLVPNVESPASIKAAPQDRFRRSMAERLDQLKEHNKVRPPGEPYKAYISPDGFMIELYYAFCSAIPGYDFASVALWLIDQMADKIEELAIDRANASCYTDETKLKKYRYADVAAAIGYQPPGDAHVADFEHAPPHQAQPPVAWVNVGEQNFNHDIAVAEAQDAANF